MGAPDLVQRGVQSPEISKNSLTTEDPPIASVPPEVLGYILNFVYQTSDANQDKRATSPVVFSHVCRFWRSVALDNPLWWSRVFASPPWKLDEVKAFLERSKECSLDLRIFVNTDIITAHRSPDSLPWANYQNLRDLISPHIHRCRIFRLQGYFDKYTVVRYLLESFRGVYMPYLEQFIVDPSREFQRKISPMKLFSSAPLLRDLRLGGDGLINYLPPLCAITKLHIMWPAPTELISVVELNAVFNACTCLTELALYDDILQRVDLPLSPLFVFPLLLTLQLLSGMESVSEFLILISSAPKLRRLVLVPVTELDLKMLNTSTPRPNFPSLTSILLSPMNRGCWAVIGDASACFPAITQLILTNIFPDYFGSFFSEQTTPLFPCLLDLVLKDVDETLGNMINDFVVFRLAKRVPLRTVFVDEGSIRYLSPYSHLWGTTKVVGVDLIGPLGEDLTHRVKNRFVGRYKG